MNRWRRHLLEGETVRWEGRPAPRAFTFRNWRWSAGGLVVCLPVFALAAAMFLGPGMRRPPVAGSVTMLIIGLLGFWGTVGHLFYARLRWEREFYALTDRRLLVKSGLFCGGISALNIVDLGEVFLSRQGAALGTVTVQGRAAGRPIILFCLEYPELFLEKLPQWQGKN